MNNFRKVPTINKNKKKRKQKAQSFCFFEMMSALRRPSGLLIDLSGTIHIENQEIKGSINAVKLLRRKNIPFLFVTNTSKESQKALKNRLDHIGFDIKSEEIFSSLTAAYNLIKSRELKPMLLISESALEVCIHYTYYRT